MVVSPGGNYTKHIYAGNQRIASRLANGTMNAANTPKAGGKSNEYYNTRQNRLIQALKSEYDSLGAVYTAMPVSFTGSGTNSGNLLYFYHPDHLGSSSLITNADGIVTQHVEYVPFGEVFIEERNSTWNTPYLFNSKELDEETGLYYYGARFYEPRTSVWLSVDPLAEKYVGVSSYVYCANNPINMIDPDGRSTEVISAGNGRYTVIGGSLTDKNRGIYVVTEKDGKYERTGEKLGNSLTMYSFYNSDSWDAEEGMKVGWVGYIDVNSEESKNLVENFREEAQDMGLLYYMFNATDGRKYDFKRNGDKDNNDRDFHHRGSKWGKVDTDGSQIYGSARDAGNFAAGYIAGLNGLEWNTARKGFDGLENLKSGNKESFQSTLAQRVGHTVGFSIYLERMRGYNSNQRNSIYPAINLGVVPFYYKNTY